MERPCTIISVSVNAYCKLEYVGRTVLMALRTLGMSPCEKLELNSPLATHTLSVATIRPVLLVFLRSAKEAHASSWVPREHFRHTANK
jgi:hypothetical protein